MSITALLAEEDKNLDQDDLNYLETLSRLSLHEFVRELNKRGIHLWVEGQQLQFRASKGAFSAELKGLVKRRKPELITYLSGPTSVPREKSNYPLSIQQQRLWFLNKLEPESSTYHCPILVPLDQELDINFLNIALSRLVERHESLRMGFTAISGKPVATLHSNRSPGVVTMTCENREVAQRELNRFIQQPFDLEKECLIRVALLSYGKRRHYLVMCMHHIITDGWSMAILEKDLMALYRAEMCQQNASLPELSLQYVDYCEWQVDDLRSRIVPTQLGYWKKVFSTLPEPINLPSDFPRPPIKSGRGKIYQRSFEAVLLVGLKKLAEQEGVTLYMLTLAIFKLLLARYCQQWDICVGTPVANRPNSKFNDLIGFFVNTLAIRSHFSEDLSFSSLLKTVKASCLGAFEHQELPFEQLVAELNIPRDMSRSPIFQVMFALQNAGGGMQQTSLSPDINGAKFDLNVSLFDNGSQLTLSCEYSTDLYSDEGVEKLFSSYETLIRGILANSHLPLRDYPLVSLQEHKQIKKQSQGLNIDYGFIDTISAFKAHVKLSPQTPAVSFANRRISYIELDRLSDQFALRLANRVCPGDKVAILMERSLELPVAILGILKLGAAYLPIDTSLPEQRIKYIAKDAQTPVLVHASDNICDDLLESGHVFQFRCEELEGNKEFPARTRSPHHPAYVIYTSGSTGVPKGVINSEAALHNRLSWMQDHFPISNADRVLQKTNYAFDVSVWEFIWPLREGAEMVLAEPGGHKDPGYLQDLIEAQQVTIMHFVPSMLRIFLQSAQPDKIKTLRAVYCSGEALDKQHVDDFYTLGLETKLFNLYGPTEAAIDVSYWDCEKVAQRESLVPIGHPIDNTTIYVLDPSYNLLPTGVPGEIFISGVNLSQGYLNLPAKTADTFIPDPFASGKQLYRTGDKGRYLNDGSIEYLGRLDFQVKLRGLRIEIGEIEHRLSQLEEIDQACVVVKCLETTGEDMLLAYLEHEGELEASRINPFLAEFLPDYMIPQRYISLKKLPLTQNGKLNRKELQQRSLPLPKLQNSVAPSSELEQKVLAIWREVLAIENLGVEHNFFELGGTSLLMVQVQQQLENSLGRNVALVKLFSYPTIRALAKFLSDEQRDSAEQERATQQLKSGAKRLANLRRRRTSIN